MDNIEQQLNDLKAKNEMLKENMDCWNTMYTKEHFENDRLRRKVKRLKVKNEKLQSKLHAYKIMEGLDDLPKIID